MNGFEDIIQLWRKEGLLPPEGTPAPRPKEFDVKQYVTEQRMSRWKEYCPEEFQKPIDRSLLPNPKAWDDADKWDGSYPGLWLWSHGTGLGKSRMLWRKFCQLHVRNGKNVVRVTGMNLAEEYHDAFNKSKTAEFYRTMTSFQVVMLDDLDKMVLPEPKQGYSQQDHGARNARMLREVFDRFYEAHTPVLVTSNESVEWFEERIGPSGARRMKEVCRSINFSTSKPCLNDTPQ